MVQLIERKYMLHIKNIFIVVLIMVALLFSVVGCDSKVPTADQQLAKETADAGAEANRQTGYPAITNYQEKKLVKLIYEERDKANLICYAYFYNREKGTIGAFLGKCVGYGIPASVQFSNPERIVRQGSSGGTWYRGPMPQPEPNQLFMPEGLSATWLMLVNPHTTKADPVYIEPLITVSPFPLHDVASDSLGLAGRNFKPPVAVAE